MQFDVLVVGGGIGGLTVAALLAARGFNVCLFERNSNVGGCISRIEYSQHDFEPGMGLYTEWGPGEIHERIFSELPVAAPETQLVEDDYVVRIPGPTDVRLRRDAMQFAEELRTAFPESAAAAVAFYELVDARRADAVNSPTLEQLQGTSEGFQQFIDAQLRAFIQTPLERCAFSAACRALSLPRQKLYSIEGGPATVAERLAEAIKKSGGRVRLNTPVLRLAYDDSGQVVGVDLLSGERVFAKRAIVSNMTIWDTYGKLIGLNRTPPEIKKLMAAQKGSGAYVVYASMEATARKRLPGERFLIQPPGATDTSWPSEITFATSARAPSGKVAVTIKTMASVDDWFRFQSSEEDYESWDQEALEQVWGRLHATLPELGGEIEILETANPRTFYDETRRKLGMVMGIEQIPGSIGRFTSGTSLPQVFMIGDTVSGTGLTSVTKSADALATSLIRDNPP